MATPYMGLTLPVVSNTPGPLYASENNQAFLAIDQHDHSPGYGVPVPSSGISINADLSFNGFNILSLRSSLYASQSAPLTLPTDIRSIYVVGGDLYYNNGLGQSIQITAGAALNATTIGGIGGDYATSTASLFYTSISSTFTFWSAVNTPAAVDFGPLTIREITTSPFGITINSPSALSADYSLTLMPSLPPSLKILTVDNSGSVAATLDVDNSSIVNISNTLQVGTAGIINSMMAANSVANNNIQDNTIGIVKIQSNLRTPTTFLADSTYTVPDDVQYIKIIACGGGSGGGGGSNNIGGQKGGGGGAGAPVFEGIIEVTPGATYDVVIGQGGTGGINGPTGAPGNAGSETRFGGTNAYDATLVVPGALYGGRGANDPNYPGWPGIPSGVYSVGAGYPIPLSSGVHLGGMGQNGGTGTSVAQGGYGYKNFTAGPQTEFPGCGGYGNGSLNGCGGAGGGSYGIGGVGGTNTGGFQQGGNAAANTGAGGGGGVGGSGGAPGGNGGSGILIIYPL